MRCSIVIPTYNRKESLRRTLDALALQTLDARDFEVIVVSDGSADGTPAMLSEYAASGTLQLRPFQQENAGPAAARNRGIAEAGGEVIVFIDDDVEPVPICLERHLSHHERDSRAVVLGPLSPDPAYAAAEPPWIAWEHAKLQKIYALFSPGGKHQQDDAGAEHFYSGNASVRREWLLQVGGFDARFKRQEDVELATRLASQCRLRFVWDFAADAFHHPVRTLDSWLKIPTSYGALDAERVLTGTLSATDVERNLTQRHHLTRVLSTGAAAIPALLSPTVSSLCAAARLLDKSGRRDASLAALSAAYNMLYSAAYQTTLAAARNSSPPKAPVVA